MRNGDWVGFRPNRRVGALRPEYVVWEKSLDEAVALLGLQQLEPAWDAVRQVLGRSWRGSMLAECVNSLLRPVLVVASRPTKVVSSSSVSCITGTF